MWILTSCRSAITPASPFYLPHRVDQSVQSLVHWMIVVRDEIGVRAGGGATETVRSWVEERQLWDSSPPLSAGERFGGGRRRHLCDILVSGKNGVASIEIFLE